MSDAPQNTLSDPLGSLWHKPGQSDGAKAEFARAQLEFSSQHKPAVNHAARGFRKRRCSAVKTKRPVVSRVCFGFFSFVSPPDMQSDQREEREGEEKKIIVLGPSFLLMQPFGHLKRRHGDHHNRNSNNNNN